MSDELDVLNNDDEQKKRALLATALAPTGFPQMSAVVPPPSGGIPPVVGPKINPVNPHATELDRLTNPEKMSSKAGWQQIKNPFLKTLAGIGSTVGGLVAPGVAAAIPGTSMHHNVLVNQQESLLNQDVKRGQVEAARPKLPSHAAHA
jgi:hypothetical protein